METPYPQFHGPEMGRPGFAGFGFAPPGPARRHARRHFREHVREQMASGDGPGGFGPRGGLGPGFGFGPGFGPGFGFGPGGRGGRRGHGRGRGRRGDVRTAILALLAERPMHGYEMIQEIAERTSGVWKPSPGSVYPTLQLLVDEGLIVGTETDGSKKLFELTEPGREAAEKIVTPPWDEIAEDIEPGHLNLRAAIGQLFGAVAQSAHTASPEQQQRIVDIVNNARREIYQILGESD
jgi:DNA-binding PadR family transcriptional regulator